MDFLLAILQVYVCILEKDKLAQKLFNHKNVIWGLPLNPSRDKLFVCVPFYVQRFLFKVDKTCGKKHKYTYIS